MASSAGLVTLKPVLARTEAERDAAIERLVGSIGEVLVEDVVTGGAWRVHFVRTATGIATLTLRAVRAYPPRTGQSSVQRVDGRPPELVSLATRLLDASGYTGPGSVQAIAHGDGYFVHDVNLRLPVSVGASIVAGLDMPALAVRASLGDERLPGPFVPRPAFYVSLLGETAQLRDALRRRPGSESPLRVAADIARAIVSRNGVLDPVNVRDPLPIVLGGGELARRRLLARAAPGRPRVKSL
jgi:hypothetical protein